MATNTKTIWQIVDLTAVCALQSLGSTGSLLLNGTLVDNSIPNQISFISNNFIRSVSITSGQNLSSTTFTVSGIQNGAFVTENITGPNNNTVYGLNYYDIITSVIANAAIAAPGVSVGTGKVGYLPLVQVNNSNASSYINYSCSVLLPAGSGINYSLLQTLEKVNNNWIPLQTQNTIFFPSMGLTNQTTSQIGNSTIIVSYLLLHINSSTTPLTDTLTFIFTQA